MDFIGTGIRFPLKINSPQRGVATSTATASRSDLLDQAAAQILGTRRTGMDEEGNYLPGERVMEPEFGSRLPELIHEPLGDPVTDALLRFYSIEALKRWEKRRQYIGVAISHDFDNRRADITLFYVDLKTGLPGNMVYPFYHE